MAKTRKATNNQITDAVLTLQKVLESEPFSLTANERMAMMETKRALKVLVEMREKN